MPNLTPFGTSGSRAVDNRFVNETSWLIVTSLAIVKSNYMDVYVGEKHMKWGKPSTKSRHAYRERPSRWGDARLWLGVIVLIGSMFVGARVVSSGEQTVTLWRATQDLAVGSPSLALEPVTVEMGSAGNPNSYDRYVQGNVAPTGTVIRPIGQGEFLPTTALAATPLIPEGTRIVSIPVDPLHLATGINAGDQVDVWSTADPTQTVSSVVAAPEMVLANITVIQVASEVVGTGGDIGIVLSVPETDIPSIVQAMRTGVIDLVKVPFDQSEAM